MPRLFVAIALPDAVREGLARLQSGVPDARWVKPENLHLTLRFIGEVDDATARDIDAALGAVRGPEFCLSLRGVGQFGRRRKVDVLWAGVTAGEELERLQKKVDQAIRSAGVAPEGRKYDPHITLARPRNTPLGRVTQFLSANGLYDSGEIEVNGFTLFESRLSPKGAEYLALAEYPLA